MRFHLKVFLQKPEHQLEGLIIEDVPNIGLSLFYDRRHILIWKGNGGELPIAGVSRKRKQFLDQELRQVTLFDIDAYLTIPVDMNHVIKWNSNVDGRLAAVYLSCPKGKLSDWQPADVYWTRILQHPVESRQLDITKTVSDATRDNRLPFEYIEEEFAAEETSDDQR